MSCPAWVDARVRVHVLLWAVLAGTAYGLVAAIVPNPVFGRQIPPEPFAVAVWLLSAPLIGIIGATYSAPWGQATAPVALLGADGAVGAGAVGDAPSRDGGPATWLGGAASLGAFLAIGCPVCNKVALVLLGTSGALSVWAPIQPILGAV